VLEEFYPPNTAQQDQGNQQPNVAANLNERLAQQTQSLNA